MVSETAEDNVSDGILVVQELSHNTSLAALNHRKVVEISRRGRE